MADYNGNGPNDYTNAGGTTGLSQQGVDPRKIWDRAVSIHEGEEDPFMSLEGGKDSIIETKTETASGAGSTIKFTVTSEFGDEGKQGDDLFETSDDFEEMLLGDFELTVDWLRGATRWKKRGMEKMGLGTELTRKVPQQLGSWLGKMKSHSMLMTMLHKSNTNNHFYVNTDGEDALTIGDTLSYDAILKGGAILKPLGGTPAKIGRDASGNPIWGSVVMGTDNAVFGLKNDPVYRANLQSAMDRGMGNYLFSGGVAKIDGHLIKEYVPRRGDIEGAVGSPLNPQALLGYAISAGTATFDIKGGNSNVSADKTKKKYFKYFPKFAFRWSPLDILADLTATTARCWKLTATGYDNGVSPDTPASDVFYVRIQNPPNAATDAGKWGFYEVSTNDGNKLTVSARLGGTANSGVTLDIRHTTIGGVTWNSAIHTATHAIGSLVVLCNKLGTPLGATPFMFRQMAYRGYGSVRNQRQEDSHNGGFVQERYIESVFGQCLREDRVGNKPALSIIKHAISYPGLIDQ
jgi:hypothetical protein